MTTSTPVPPAPPATTGESSAGTAVAVRSPRSTVQWLRLQMLVLALLLGAFATLGTIAGVLARNATQTIEQNTAPALVTVQALFASTAEADAAATGAFISSDAGTENRILRNLYLEALGRASSQTEEVASLVGANERAHLALREIGQSLVSYSGGIESARVSQSFQSEAGVLDETTPVTPSPSERLADALTTKQGAIEPAIGVVSDEMRTDLNDGSSAGWALAWVAVVLGVLAIAALVWTQWKLIERTNRILNPPLVLATLLALTTVLLVTRGLLVRKAALDNALEGGYDSIVAAAEMQTDAYELQSAVNLSQLGAGLQATDILQAALDTAIENIITEAESPRELAAAQLLEARWDVYRSVPDDANVQLSEFNGLNTSIESVISDNRRQFIDGVASAADAVSNMPLYAFIGPLLALLASLYGIQLRLREYS